MNDVQTRVAQCFLMVFPDLTEDTVAQVTQRDLAPWDSLAHVTLLAALAEEFNFDLGLEAFQALDSYQSIVEYVQVHATR